MVLLSVFGDIETFIADDLYPYRYVITPVLAALAAGALFLAYKQGLHRRVWRHRLASVVVGLPLLIFAVVAGDYHARPLCQPALRKGNT